MLVTCFQSHLAVFRSAFESLHSGGYIELQDASFPFLDMWNETAFQHWIDLFMEGAKIWERLEPCAQVQELSRGVGLC